MAELCYESIQWSPFVCGGPVDLRAQIRAAAAAGFDGVSLDVWSLRAHRDQGGTLDEVARWIADAGSRCLEVQALVVTDDAGESAAAAEEMSVLVDALGPDFVMCGFPGEATDAAVAHFADAVERLPSGPRVGLEFLPTLPVNDIAAARAVLQRAGSARTGVVVDVWHFSHGPSTWEDLEALGAEEIAFVQFSDHPPLASSDLTDEMLRRRVFPGDGVLDLDRFVSVLRANGFDGMVGVEVISEPLRELGYDEFARRAHRAAARYWS